MTRIGFNVNVESGLDWAYYVDIVRRLRPTFSLHLRDWDLRRAREIVVVTAGQTKVIVRLPDGGDAEKFHWRQGDDLIHKSLDAWETLNGATDPNIYFNILNESPTNVADDISRISAWLARFMHSASQRGLKLCVFNSGVDQSLHLDEGRYDELLRALALYKGQHLLGVHEYAGPSMPNSVSHPPEWMRDVEHLDHLQPGNWPSPAEIQVTRQNGAYPPYWLIFRGIWLAIRSRELGLGDPDMVITELGWDRLPNLEAAGVYAALEQRYGWPSDRWGRIRGINTLVNVWAEWWLEWLHDEAAFQQFQWWERVAPVCYKGACYFSWWPSSEWSDMDIAGHRLLHGLMIEAAQKPAELPPLPEIPPEPPLPPPPEIEPPRHQEHQEKMWALATLAVIGILLVIVLLFNRGGAFAAQGVSEMENGLNDLFVTLFAWLNTTTTLVWAIPATQLVTALLKRIIPDSDSGVRFSLSGRTLALTVQVIFWIIWALFQYRGQGDLFQNVITDASPIAEGLFNLFIGGLVGQVVYDRFAGKGVLHQRTKPTA